MDKNTIQEINKYYTDMDDRFLTPEVIEAMAEAHRNETFIEGRIIIQRMDSSAN